MTNTQHQCPDCGSPGKNTELGYIIYECGAEWIVGEGSSVPPCPSTMKIERSDVPETYAEKLKLRLEGYYTVCGSCGNKVSLIDYCHRCIDPHVYNY
jgi:hypothetical protein